MAAMQVNGTSASGTAYSRIASASFKVIGPAATFGSFSDTAVDDNANGRPDRIVITATVNVQTTGNYFFTIQLLESNSAKLLSKARATLQAGTRQIEASFDIAELRSLNANGPYTLKNAELIYEDGSGDLPVVDFRENVGTTQSYQLSSFERDPIIFTGPNSIEEIYDNRTGKIEKLIIRVNVDVLNAGQYSWSAALLDSSGEEIDYYSTTFMTTFGAGGPREMAFVFDGQEISRSQKNGPYTIGRIDVAGAGDASLDVLMTTSAYSYTQFEPPIVLHCSDITVTAPDNFPIYYPLPKVTGAVNSVSISCGPAPGSRFRTGPTIVSCTAIESVTNHTDVASFTLTVTSSGDTTPPVITAPTIAYAVIPYGQANAPLTYYPSPTATDNSGVVSLTCTPALGANISRGLTTVTCTATDTAGNQSTVSFPL